MKKAILASVLLVTGLFAGYNPTDFKERKVMMQPNDVKYHVNYSTNKCELTDGIVQNHITYEYNTFSWNLVTRLEIFKDSDLLPNGTFIEVYSEMTDNYNHFFSNLKDCNTFRINRNRN